MFALLFLALCSIVLLLIAGSVAKKDGEFGFCLGFIGIVSMIGVLLVARAIHTGTALAESAVAEGVVYKVIAAGENHAMLRPYYGDGETKLYKLKTVLPSPAPACVVRIKKGSDTNLQAVSCPAPIKPATK